MSNKPANLPPPNNSPAAGTSSRATNTLKVISRTIKLITLAADSVPPPAGHIIKAIGGSITVILDMVQLHLKNEEDAENLVSDIESTITLICGETKSLSPLTSPSFFEAVEKFKVYLDSVRDTLQSQPPRRRKRDIAKFWKAPSVQKKLLSYGQDIRKFRENLMMSQQFDIQRKVGMLLEGNIILEQLRPTSRKVRDTARAEPCMAGTRKDILREVQSWAQDLDSKNILWINGSPGAGKSAISASIVQELSTQNCLGAFYPFRQGEAELATPFAFWHTILYDLVQDPSLSGHKQFHASLRQETLGFLNQPGFDAGDKDIEAQFRVLIQGPLANHAVSGVLVVVIDALDECGKETDIYFHTFLRTLVSWGSLPKAFKLVVTSRNLHSIERTLSPISQVLTISTGSNVSKAASADVRMFLDQHLPKVTPDDCAILEMKAAGLFIWATTAVKFLHRGPWENRLKQILSTSLLGGVNQLYEAILHEAFGDCSSDECMEIKEILSVFALAQMPIDKESLLHLTGTGSSMLEFCLEKLRPVLTQGSQMNVFTISHLSFVEYILDPKGGHLFHIDANLYNSRLAKKCLEIMIHGLQFNIGDLPTSYKANQDIENIDALIRSHIPGWLAYACQFWSSHFQNHTSAEREIVESIESLLLVHFLNWLEVLSLLQNVDSIFDALSAIADNLKNVHKTLALFALDCMKFVAMFKPAIAKSVPHIYLSGLAFAPKNCLLSKQYYKKFVQLPEITNGATDWPALEQICWIDVEIHGVAYSPDGKHIISGSGDNNVRVWNATTGAEMSAFEGHTDVVLTVAYSPDGKHIVSGSGDKTIKIWNAITGAEISVFQGHEYPVMSVSYAPDGNHIVSGSRDNSVRVWDVTTSTETFVLQGHEDAVWSVAYSPNGKHIVSGSWDQTLRVWDATTGTEVLVLQGHEDFVWSVAYSPDGKHIVSGSEDNSVRVWDANTGTEISILQGHNGSVWSVAYSPNGMHIVSGSEDNSVRVWDANTSTEISILQGHEGSVWSVAYSPDGMHIVSGSRDKSLKIWNTTVASAKISVQQGHEDAVWSVAYSPDGKHIVSGSWDQTVRVWNTNTGTEVSVLQGHQNAVWSVAYSPDGRHIVSGSWDHSVRVWDATTGTEVSVLQGHDNYVWSVAYSPDGNYIASGSSDKSVKVWDAGTSSEISTFQGHEDSVMSVAYSPDGKHIVSGSADKSIRVWDVVTSAEMLVLLGHQNSVLSVIYSPNGKHIISGSEDNSVRVWSTINSETTILQGHDDAVLSVACSFDEKYILSGSRDKSIRVWDIATKTQISVLQGHEYPVLSVAYSANGQHIVSGSRDKSVRIWNVTTSDLSVSQVGQSLLPWKSAVANHIYFTPTLTIKSNGWAFLEPKLQTNFLFWVPSFYPKILYTSSHLVISKQLHSQVTVGIHGHAWNQIAQS